MTTAAARGRESALAGLLCLLACNAEIGPAPPSAIEEADAAGDPPGSIDAAAPDPDAPPPPADAAPPDAQACAEGDRRTQDPDTGTCYFLFEDPIDWEAARTACQDAGGDLARIDSEEENDLVFELAGGLIDVWMGGNDREVEDLWVWLDDDEPIDLLYNNWREGEPNDKDGEDCMILEADNPAREWDDRACADLYPFLCER